MQNAPLPRALLSEVTHSPALHWERMELEQRWVPGRGPVSLPWAGQKQGAHTCRQDSPSMSPQRLKGAETPRCWRQYFLWPGPALCRTWSIPGLYPQSTHRAPLSLKCPHLSTEPRQVVGRVWLWVRMCQSLLGSNGCQVLMHLTVSSSLLPWSLGSL